MQLLEKQLLAAESFFDDAPRIQSRSLAVGRAGDDTNYVDPQGLVQFIVFKRFENNPVVNKNLIDFKDILIGMTSIVTAHINKAAAGDPSKRYDANLWHNVMGQLPMFGTRSFEKSTYTRDVKGIEIAQGFIDFIMTTAISQGTAALAAFQTFLQDQGKAIRMGVERNSDSYETITLSIVSSVMDGPGGVPVYVPSLNMYRIKFNRNNYKVYSSCASHERVNISFEFEKSIAQLDPNALFDPYLNKSIRDFIYKKQKEQIENANTFFSDDNV